MSTQKKNVKLQSVISYTLPKLYTGKDWYIGFYAFCPAENQLKLKRIKLNHIQKVSERRKYASDLMLRISNELRRGWNPWVYDSDSKEYTSFDEVCDAYKKWITHNFNKDVIREDTYVGYMSYLRNLVRYNKGLKNSINYIYQFDKAYISDFLDHVYIDRENSAQTRDNYLGWIRVFSSYLVGRSYLKTKPCEGIESFSKRLKKKRRTEIPQEDLTRIRDYVASKNKYYLLACYILFYCFIRPKELSRLKIQDISLKHKTIMMYIETSKNKKDAAITINMKIINLMLDLEIFKYPGGYYLFSDKFAPGAKQKSAKQFRDFWLDHVRSTLKLPTKYKFYSLKDTGVTMMLKRNVDNLSVRDQARHSSLLMTDTYTPHDIQDANELLVTYDTFF